VVPKDAAALILLRDPSDPQVFWVKRSHKLSFMGGWQAFPGGQREPGDDAAPVRGCENAEAAALRICAIREVFEETGLLIARGVERLTQAELASWREALSNNQLSFAELISQAGLEIAAEMLLEAPRWVTPPPSPKRFNTHFFAAWVPVCADGPQQAGPLSGELSDCAWLRPAEAVAQWQSGAVLAAPPVILPILEMYTGGIAGFAERLQRWVEAQEDMHRFIEPCRGFLMFPVRTPTQPPATHTNCYVVGGAEVVIIDPGSPYPEEQARLDGLLDAVLAQGRRLREILITHLHPDHIGGVNHVAQKYGLPVATHRLTAAAIAAQVSVDRFIEDDELTELDGGQFAPGLSWRLRALWSPGHARGHLSFYEERTGCLITGDCIVGLGTVVIAPPEGNMCSYLESLERMLQLPKLTALFPAHGPAVADARAKIEEYIQHRHDREAMIVSALVAAPLTIPEIVQRIYTDIPVSRHPLAELSVLAHLEKLEAEGRVQQQAGQYAIV
jgi:glyoxylase-like metal-dependent hydrolase (beta-lactamase superfamily II)/8-oxo-dGTP pyrophosphatase MutT (NUDIX family)